jgi:DNA-binding NtrC family response regulator
MASNTSVLIVEDEPAIVELVSYSLRETGWEIRTAANVASAWESIVKGGRTCCCSTGCCPTRAACGCCRACAATATSRTSP